MIEGIFYQKVTSLLRLKGLVIVSKADTSHDFVAILATPGKFEAKRLEALEHSNDGLAVPSSGYSASHFTGSAFFEPNFVFDDAPSSSIVSAILLRPRSPRALS